MLNPKPRLGTPSVTLQNSFFKPSKFYLMNNLISDCKKAVNQAKFRPTAQRKAVALRLLAQVFDQVQALEEVAEPKPKKAKKKTAKKKSKKSTKVDYSKFTKAQLIEQLAKLEK